MHENTDRTFICMKTQKGEDYYEDCATCMDDMSNAKTFTKTAKVVNEDATI